MHAVTHHTRKRAKSSPELVNTSWNIAKFSNINKLSEIADKNLSTRCNIIVLKDKL